MIRVSGLKEQIAEGVSKPSPDGMSAAEQLREIRELVRPMVNEQMPVCTKKFCRSLPNTALKFFAYKDLNSGDKKKLDEYFLKNIFPVLTPQAVDVSHPFPYVSNLSLNLGLIVEPDKSFTHGKLEHLYNQSRFVRIKTAAEYSASDSD